jgi:hypothetical protein
MQLLFFCASLEPGRDGVGDYTRRLAGACAARGHGCTAIALHDPHVARATDLTEDGMRLIRLPAAAPWPGRLACAIGHQRRLAPDWVSWQFVAYGFNPRGLVPSELWQGAAHLSGSRCHVMMHELWIGLEAGSGWLARAAGWRQRWRVLRLLDQLSPDCVQTSNAAYQSALRDEGLLAGVTGVFGNVPVADGFPGRAATIGRWLPDAAGFDAPPLVSLTFGTLHPQWRPAATADWLVSTAGRLARAPALIVIGRAGSHAAAILDLFRRRGVTVRATGELDATAISHLLRAADFGIAPHPWALIGKSGAAAAMLEHGLPVLVPRDEWRLRRASATAAAAPGDPLLVRLAGLDAARTDRWLASRRPPEPALPRIADDFLAALGRWSPRSPALLG